MNVHSNHRLYFLICHHNITDYVRRKLNWNGFIYFQKQNEPNQFFSFCLPDAFYVLYFIYFCGIHDENMQEGGCYSSQRLMKTSK